ncbi:methionyl-tRNA formyltransferase [Halorussus litoreus]|uniref:methionyl-tRNA formyltransferase n=1 Tax=Halorussus litoreus TaxID=1710536 RepID=UPI0013001D93|nr:formyltransferase family protein [Halorussus litoreus]
MAIVTQDDPFYVPLFFESFFSRLSDGIEVESIVELPSFDESGVELARRMFGFYGPVGFVRRGVEFAGRTALDAVGVGRYSVASVADEYGVPVERRESVNDPAFVERLRKRDVDVLLSVSAPEIFDVELLDAPNWGCLNVHTADLPNYRGMMPTFWALYHGEEEVGVTVHTMAEEIDRGEAVRRTSFPVADDDTLDDVISRGKEVGGELAARALDDIEEGRVSRSPIEGEGSYFSFPTPDERREFQHRGGELL